MNRPDPNCDVCLGTGSYVPHEYDRDEQRGDRRARLPCDCELPEVAQRRALGFLGQDSESIPSTSESPESQS